MAECHVVSALVEKHREIAGQIEHHRREAERLTGDLAHVDATLRLVAPELDLRTLQPKAPRQRDAVFRPGEVPRTVLDVLRQAQAPLTSRVLAERALSLKGWEAAAERVTAVQKTLTPVLRHLTTEGVLREGPAAGTARTWILA